MEQRFTVVIPAKNEESTVQSVIYAIRDHPIISRVIVVDNGSTDNTFIAASSAGALVISEPVPGLGRAVKRGIAAADTEYILRTDADITNWNPAWISLLCQSKTDCLTRGVFISPYDEFPITRLVVRPYLEAFLPFLSTLQTPITGTYSFNINNIEWQLLPDNWSWDIALVIQAYERGLNISDVDIGMLVDKPRDIDHYEPMARDIHQFFLKKYTILREGEI